MRDSFAGKEEADRPQGSMQGGEFGEDMLQMALRMAQEMPDEALDLEHSINPSTINPGANQDQCFSRVCVSVSFTLRD